MKMSKIIKLLLLTCFLTALHCVEANANTRTAASCNESDVSAALSQTLNGDTVIIPAGTCTWTTPLTYNAPGSISIIGAGKQTVVGGGDMTVIIDNVSHTPTDNPTLQITTGAANSVFRLSGITIQGGTGGTTYNGALRFYGNSQNFRMDHVHFNLISGISSLMDGWMYGVVDHCLWDMHPNSVDNGLRVGHSSWNGYKYGDGSWADSTTFGSNRFIFMEDNTFNYGFADDLNNGGRLVFRHNTLNLSEFQIHEMEDRGQGSRAFEFYSNLVTCDPSQLDCGSTVLFLRTGTGLVWGNTASNIKNFITANNDRTNGHPFNATPNGWGYCGTQGSIAGPSAWDQNSDSTGYPCINQVGRGKGNLLPQSYWPATPAWPNEALEPVYEWNNMITFAPNWGGVRFSADSTTIAQNRDVYLGTGSASVTNGVGSGLLSARPSTCAAGPGGNTNGVAYWATDNNTLYVCNPTDTWTAYYTPYNYPHPLTNAVSSGTPPSAPTNLAAAVQ